MFSLGIITSLKSSGKNCLDFTLHYKIHFQVVLSGNIIPSIG